MLSVASATYFEIVSEALKGTSSDFGQLVVQRHFNSGIDCAMAGAATVVDAASPAPAVFQEFTTFHDVSPLGLHCDRQAKPMACDFARRRLSAILFLADISRSEPGTPQSFQGLKPPGSGAVLAKRAYLTARYGWLGTNRSGRSRQPAVAPIQADNVATISLMTSRSFLPERASTWKE